MELLWTCTDPACTKREVGGLYADSAFEHTQRYGHTVSYRDGRPYHCVKRGCEEAFDAELTAEEHKKANRGHIIHELYKS